MKSLLGWFIIVAGLGFVSLVLLSPFYLWARRRRRSRATLLSYLAASALCGTAIWICIPWLVHGLFGHATP
jgi:predicted PurR-regulated permease PerM